MKNIRTKFFALAFLALGISAGITSCGKDDEGDNNSGTKKTDNLKGTFIGTHYLEISDDLLNALSATLPPDPETGEKVDLKEGFVDTLSIQVVDGVVKVTSNLLDVTVEGEVTADNTFKIKEHKYPQLQLGSSVTATDASVQTNKDVTISGSALGTNVPVALRLKANKIGTFTIPLNITTKGTFVKTEL